MVTCEIISVGDEVLRGDVVNTNASFLSGRLSRLGFAVRYRSAVGDNEEDLLNVVRTAMARSNVIILTGGLGPTKDDLTKETVAKAVGREMIFHPESEERIASWYRSRGMTMTQNNRKQAMVIEGADVLTNRNGTAPGIYLEENHQAIILLPGPPRELEALYEDEVQPRLLHFMDSKRHVITLSVFGIGESALEEQIKDLLYGDNPTAACYAKTGEVEVRIIGRGETEEEAFRLANELTAAIKERVGSLVYSDNGLTLAESVVNLLKKNCMTIALAESCTGGRMAAAITDIAGASDLFSYGITAYSDTVKEHRLQVPGSMIKAHTSVSASVAGEMARGAKRISQSDIGVGITGYAGPARDESEKDQVGLVYIAVALRDQLMVKEFRFGTGRSRGYVRMIAVKNAFDLVRRILENLPTDGAKFYANEEIAD